MKIEDSCGCSKVNCHFDFTRVETTLLVKTNVVFRTVENHLVWSAMPGDAKKSVPFPAAAAAGVAELDSADIEEFSEFKGWREKEKRKKKIMLGVSIGWFKCAFRLVCTPNFSLATTLASRTSVLRHSMTSYLSTTSRVITSSPTMRNGLWESNSSLTFTWELWSFPSDVH